MPKKDLLAAVTQLVEVARAGGAASDRALKTAVNRVVGAFDAGDATTAKKALRALAAGAADAEGRAAQVLHLTMGALVEAGAPAELAWPTLAQGLPELLVRATRFGRACVKRAGNELVEEALAEVGAEVAAEKPADARAWQELSSRCLAAIACLTRSRKVREAARADARLLEAADPLSTAVAEVAVLVQAVLVIDDEPLVVLHPGTRRGYRVRLRQLASNAELVVLLADALVGDTKKGLLPGERPDPRAVAALQGRGKVPARASEIVAAFELLPWTALTADGTLTPEAVAHHHGVLPLDGFPAGIPPLADERVVLLADAAHEHVVQAEPTFDALHPEVRLTSKMPAAEVDALLRAIAKKAHAPKRARRR